MRPSLYDDDHDDRLARLEGHDRDVASQIAAMTVQIASLTEKMAEGFNRGREDFARFSQQMTALVSTLHQQVTTVTRTQHEHGQQMQSFGEFRDRQRSIARWVGGIVSAVVVAALVMALGLRR